MKIYLAGPMRGYPESNFPAFIEAAKKLRDIGHYVFSPAEYPMQNRREGLAIDMMWIASFAEAIVVLPGWQQSLGANAEVALARAIEIDVILVGDLLKE